MLASAVLFAQAPRYADSETNFEKYSSAASDAPATPDEQGFIRRWLLLDPISKPNRGNTVFVDSYVRDAFAREYYKGMLASMSDVNKLPKDGQKVKAIVDGEKPIDPTAARPSGWWLAEPELIQQKVTLKWHALDSRFFNVKLFRFATGQELQKYGIILWGLTVVNCEEDMENVRLAIGSNSASMWWVNNEEVLIASGDRRMVMDDVVSPRMTLKKGRNLVRFAVINGPGMSDMCARFIDEDGNPVRNITITVK